MASNTRYYNLVKPDVTDTIDITVLNGDLDTIDAKLKEAIDGSSGAGKQEAIVMGTLVIPASWTGDGPYTQVLSSVPSGITANSKIDLQPNATVLAQLIADGVTALWVQNSNATLTAYALGAAPRVALSVQYTRTEIAS